MDSTPGSLNLSIQVEEKTSAEQYIACSQGCKGVVRLELLLRVAICFAALSSVLPLPLIGK